MCRCLGGRCRRSAIVGLFDHVGESRGIFDEREGGFREILAVVVGRVVAVVAVAQPFLDGEGVDEVVPGGVGKVLEVEAVGLSVASEIGGETLAEQLAALLEYEFAPSPRLGGPQGWRSVGSDGGKIGLERSSGESQAGFLVPAGLRPGQAGRLRTGGDRATATAVHADGLRELVLCGNAVTDL